MINIIETLTEITGKVTAVLVASLALLVVYDASNRYLFQSGSIALQELEWHLFDIIILFGVSYALKHHRHVRIDIFYDKFSNRVKRVVDIIGYLFFILPFAILLMFFSIDFMLISFWQAECSSNPGGLCYRFIIKGVVVVAFAILALQSVAMALKDIKLLKSKQ